MENKSRTKQLPPKPSRQKGQRSLDIPLYLQRYLPYWGNPEWLNAKLWRQVVLRQPVAVICRETLIANLLALDWKIEPKDSTKRDEYKDEIEYYTTFFENTGDYDYVDIIEWVGGDLLDIPFGSAIELGREGDNPKGKLLWIELLDGATLFPSLNDDWPVGQVLPELANKTVYFPWYAINRIYYTARREIKRKGWGMAPPEQIYLALELINRGDVYYANLLLDTPSAGILDLGDMAKDSAEEWVQAWREMLGGIDPFKIPVLYEHEKPINWVPFTKSPTELMFDTAISKYTSLVCAGYGMTLGDIGFPSSSSGGDTLAGTIRQERKTRRTGFAKLKKKMKFFFDRMLPDYLEFKFIDLDDEFSVALGRSRLATSTALQQLINIGILTPEEGRQQIIADGLITISIPEKLPADAVPMDAGGANNERPNQLGRPVSPSEGGHGEISQRSDAIVGALNNSKLLDGSLLERLSYSIFPIIRLEIEELGELDIFSWLDLRNKALFGVQTDNIPELTSSVIENSLSNLDNSLSPTNTLLFELDKELALEDMKEATKALLVEGQLERMRVSYIKGDVDNIELIEQTEIVGLDKMLSELIDNFSKGAEISLRKAIISGVYRFSIYNPTVDDLDDTHINLVLSIRNAIDEVCDLLLLDFSGKISDIILENLEGDNKDDTKKN